MKSLLLIDDDEIFNFIHQKILEKVNIFDTIYIYSSPVEALDFFRNPENANKVLPDVIFLDIKMPVMDGFEFLEEFNKLQPEMAENIKVAMLSSSLDPKDKTRAFNYKQVIEFINKPFDIEKLMEFKMKVEALNN